MSAAAKLRIGLLGAAKIAPLALIQPARLVSGVTVAALAARDARRARAFADKYDIPRVHESYASLLEDRAIDAVYIPLPNSLHAQWTLAALEAGKHVLCEKPFTANAGEAAKVADAAAKTDLIVAEAFHYRYHPLAFRAQEIVSSGELGTIRHLESHFCIPGWRPGHIAFRYELAGGTMMDLGCYPLNFVRYLAQSEPQVLTASARLASPQVDRYMAASFRFSDGRTGRITCSLWSLVFPRVSARVQGDQGEMSIWNPFQPHLYHRIAVRTAKGRRVEKVSDETTYFCQLRAFARAINGKGPVLTGAADAVANMRVIDAIYTQAGLKPRGT